MYYLYLKVFHIIGFTVWFAGLFYLGRLFVYHCEADDRPEPEKSTLKSQFSLMERRLYFGIAWPGLCISVVFGLALIIVTGLPGWLHFKLAFVAVLVAYHLWCGHLRKMLKKGICNWNGTKFRLFNEIPTLLLFSIVFIVVFKNAFSWNVLLIILACLMLVIGGAVLINSNLRRKKSD